MNLFIARDKTAFELQPHTHSRLPVTSKQNLCWDDCYSQELTSTSPLQSGRHWVLWRLNGSESFICKIKHLTCIKESASVDNVSKNSCKKFIVKRLWKAIWDAHTFFPLSWGCCSDFCQNKRILAQPLYQQLRHRELADWQKSIPKHVHVNVGTVYQ